MNCENTGRKNILSLSCIASGYLLGLFAAWWLSGLNLSMPGELESARQLGMVSVTILNGYAKSTDTINYLFTLSLPVLGALLAYRAFSQTTSTLATDLLHQDLDHNSFSHRSLWSLVGFMALYSWHSTVNLSAGWNEYVGAWLFLGEQGQMMAWLESLSTGGVYGKDFFCLFGPMFIYPLKWLMDIMGDHSALMERYYKFILQMIAFSITSFILLRSMRSRWLAVLFALLTAFIYPPILAPSSNTTILRSALALSALAIITFSLGCRQTRWRLFAGIVLGQSFLFSQEAAMCALISGSMILYLYEQKRTSRHLAAIREVALLYLFTAISMAPMVSYLLINGAGAALWDSLVGYPKLVMLGFGGLPFASFNTWFPKYFHFFKLEYTVISIYTGSTIALFIAWHKGTRSNRLLWGIALTVFGALAFRQAIGRSAPDQTTKVMLPALFLIAFWFDEILHNVRSSTYTFNKTVSSCIMAVVLSVITIGGILCDATVGGTVHSGWNIATTFKGKFYAELQTSSQQINPRIGFFLDTLTQQSVAEIGSFLELNTKRHEAVYFFPNEAAYYHLFERTNPTRYAHSYFATTFDRQREVIKSLETSKPRFVVISKKTWRIDNIPEDIQVPLIVDYLRHKYKPAKELYTADIFERIQDI